MEELMYNIPASKVMDLVLNEERQKIRNFLLATYGKTTSDCMDTYVPTESEIMRLFVK